jgi:hypothetical protein
MTAIRRLELGLPGLCIGVVAGLIAGGLSLLAGQPAGWAAISMLGLAVPLGLFGALYGMLMGHGVFRPGVFAPAAFFWIVGFPLGRLIQESVTGLALAGRISITEGVPQFLAFQAMVSVGFALGFVWLHERLAPYWFMRIQDGNPHARLLLARYIEHSHALWQAKESRDAARRARRDARVGHTTGRQPERTAGRAAKHPSGRATKRDDRRKPMAGSVRHRQKGTK